MTFTTPTDTTYTLFASGSPPSCSTAGLRCRRDDSDDSATTTRHLMRAHAPVRGRLAAVAAVELPASSSSLERRPLLLNRSAREQHPLVLLDHVQRGHFAMGPGLRLQARELLESLQSSLHKNSRSKGVIDVVYAFGLHGSRKFPCS